MPDETFVGLSPSARKVRKMMERVAQKENISVLIIGQTGTGKELVARGIHDMSPNRKNQSFEAYNCAAIVDNLAEATLFGAEPGSFTDHRNLQIGLFELANKGTLFLDEIGDMSLYVQGKILRAIQEKRIRRLGAQNNIDVDVRVIAATNRNLGEMVGKRKFRQDLYFRLCVFPIQVPPLRERMDDLEQIVRAIRKKHEIQFKNNDDQIITQTLIELRHTWSGNVRELENVILCASVLGSEVGPEQIIQAFQIQREFWISGSVQTYAVGLTQEDKEELIEGVNLNECWQTKFQNLSDTIIKGRSITAEQIKLTIAYAFHRNIRRNEIATILGTDTSKATAIIEYLSSDENKFLESVSERLNVINNDIVKPLPLDEIENLVSNVSEEFGESEKAPKFRNLPELFREKYPNIEIENPFIQLPIALSTSEGTMDQSLFIAKTGLKREIAWQILEFLVDMGFLKRISGTANKNSDAKYRITEEIFCAQSH